jgi:medium-chain acyl-[acyl-carrier-protein] hydrolase
VEVAFNRWLACFSRRARPKLRLLCFHHAGGDAFVFRQWHEQLFHDVELWAAQLPGRPPRHGEPGFDRLGDLIADMVGAIAPVFDEPFALFGHSMGAYLAYECAHQAERRGRVPARLFVSGCSAPHLVKAREGLSHLPDAEFLAAVRHRFGGIPDGVAADPELVGYFLPILRGDLALLESHPVRREDPLRCGITAFGGADDPYVPLHGLEAWSVYTVGQFSCSRFPGGHFYLNPSRRRLLNSIRIECAALSEE